MVFAAEGVFAVVHRLMGGEYAGFTHVYNVIADIGLASIWLASATALLIHRSFPAFFLVILGIVASFTHGLLFSISSAEGLGVPFLGAAVLLLYLVIKSVPAWRFIPADENAERLRYAPFHISWTGR